MAHLSGQLIQQFMRAAAEGAGLELRLRLLCGAVPAISHHSTAHNLADVEDAIIQHFTAVLTDEDQRMLGVCRQLRNKLLHADFHAARGKLSKLDGGSESAGVRMVKLDAGREVEHLMQLAADAATAGSTVASTGSTVEGTVFGWLLEFGLSGEFERASQAFARASAMIDGIQANAGAD